MEMPNKKILTIFIVGALLVLGGLFFMYRSYENGAFDKEDGDLESATTSPIAQEIIIAPNDFSLPIYAGRPVGALNADPKIVNQISTTAFEAHQKKLRELEERVTDQPTDVASWLSAASIKNFFNDFSGARDIWVYVTKIAPEDPVAYSNLGNLAKLETMDFSLAENYFKTAISKEKTFIPAILALAELYWDFLPNRQNEAVGVLEAGLLTNPEEVTVMLNLGRYYRELGNKERSLQYLNRALSLHPDDAQLKKAVQETEEYFR